MNTKALKTILILVASVFIIPYINNFSNGKVFVDQTCEFAEARVKEIQHDFSHAGFKRDIKNYKHSGMGENIAKGYKTVKETYIAWNNSPGHRANIERKWKYRCLRCENTYCVEIFAD